MEKKNNNSKNEKALNENELDEVSGGSEGIDKEKLKKFTQKVSKLGSPVMVAYGIQTPRFSVSTLQSDEKGKKLKEKLDDLNKKEKN